MSLRYAILYSFISMLPCDVCRMPAYDHFILQVYVHSHLATVTIVHRQTVSLEQQSTKFNKKGCM